VPHGSWSKPGVPFTITYSLPVFHEIDFLVNEGYRRIPHGGIEHGGLLFGARDSSSVIIESFRQIECEHAAGPGFSLSPKDMATIADQLKSSETDPESEGMEALGWFVSYSRRELIPSPAEFDRFRALFPHPWQAMLLVKPAKFRPTQFAVLFPYQGGLPTATLESESFSLPLPGRKKQASEVSETGKTVDTPSTLPAEAALEDERVRVASPPRLKSVRKPTKPVDGPSPAEPPHEQPPLPVELAPLEERRSTVHSQAAARTPVLAATVAILAMAACGCWFYLRYEAPAIELHVAPATEGTVVTWPAGETSEAKAAELRFWTGQTERSVKLSTAEKSAGRAVLPAESSDITVELLSHHRLYDRRGMIRLLKPLGNQDTKR
jgi:hypothetical protein